MLFVDVVVVVVRCCSFVHSFEFDVRIVRAFDEFEFVDETFTFVR